MIWTEEEDELRQLENVLNMKGKTCSNCQWGGYQKGDVLVTCGHHLQNFSPNSFCAYWTDPKDEKLLKYYEKKKKEIKKRLLLKEEPNQKVNQ